MSAQHTPGPYSVHPYSEIQVLKASEFNGEPYEHAAITIGAGSRMLGEVRYASKAHGFPVIESEEEMRAVANLWIAAPELVEAAERLLHDIGDLMANSEGVSGLHQNGDIAPWSELDEDGQYNPWLGQGIYHLRTALAKARGEA